MTTTELARRIAELTQEKLASDVVILDMQPVCSYTDYLVICSGNNARQTKAIFEEVHGRVKRELRLMPRSVAGAAEGSWILADYIDVVLHIFTPQTRDFYRLDDLWGDVPREKLEALSA